MKTPKKEVKKTPKKVAAKKVAPKKEVKPKGRPTTYTEQAANEICERMSKGEFLSDICKDEHMPALRTVYHWRDDNKDFLARFVRAREDGFEVMAVDCLKIADDGSNDYMTITKGDLEYNVEDREVTNRSKLRVETRLKLLAKWFPQKYGDKVDVTSDGEKIGGASPEQLRVIAESINNNSKKE